jgi:phosphatidate cytidylyltransferase
MLATDSFQPQRVLGMIFFIWINDTGAYLVGSFIGKHKLYEKISPNKTWEGTLGGAVLAMGLSYVVYLIFPQLAYIHWFIISIIVSVFGTFGDLVESMLKRMAGVKDSGKLMPGHGGVLDRFDSLFFATPFVFCYLALMGLL